MTSNERRRKNLIPFEEKEIKAYLDRAIHLWRRRKYVDEMNGSNYTMATHYIDAFQSVRMSLFGELLEKGDK